MAHREESPGVGELHGGFGSASLRECVSLATQATNVPSGPLLHATLRVAQGNQQVMNPNVKQNPPQDSTPKHEPLPENADQRPKRRERKEEDLTPKSEPEQAEVKEKQEENLRRRRPSDPFPFHRMIWLESDPYPMPTPGQEYTGENTTQTPWHWALNQRMSVQHDLELLRNRIAEIEDLRVDQEALSTRVRSVEECITVHHVREFMHSIITIEGRIGVSGGVIGENLRECQMRLDQCVAGIANLDTLMRTNIDA